MAPKVPEPCLCLVTDRSIVEEDTLVSRVAEAVAGGVDMVQLREKDLSGGPLLELALSLRDAIAGRALLIINDRADVAAAVGADGVQLGEEGLPVDAARRVLGAGSLIGRSVHSESGASLSEAEGCDFLVVGTMYATATHPGDIPAGPGLVRRIGERCRLPLIGIGGITPANATQVLAAGAAGVAVISSILGSPQPGEAARQIKQAMMEFWSDGKQAEGRLTPTSREGSL
ncbi:MAG: thiamine phosphate synthase [Chloroflexi bacterium]|nr:thiamine phosphate synthase [Chloroflexota bacterium]